MADGPLTMSLVALMITLIISVARAGAAPTTSPMTTTFMMTVSAVVAPDALGGRTRGPCDKTFLKKIGGGIVGGGTQVPNFIKFTLRPLCVRVPTFAARAAPLFLPPPLKPHQKQRKKI